MPIWFYILIAWILGSFCGAYAYRWPRSLSMLTPLFSQCPKCHKNIPWYHNIPIFSYLILRGRSACCKQPIAVDYLLIELSSVLIYPIVIYPFHLASPWIQLEWTVFFYFLLVQAFIDFRHRLIPDEISLGGTVLGLLFCLAYQDQVWHYFVLKSTGAILGFGSLWLIAKLYTFRTKREGLGMGDMKLLMMVGSFVTVLGVFWVIFIASLIGLVAGLGLMIYKKGTLKTAIPFGPSIAMAALFVFLASVYQRIFF